MNADKRRSAATIAAIPQSSGMAASGILSFTNGYTCETIFDGHQREALGLG
jgi:hypothetical protein